MPINITFGQNFKECTDWIEENRRNSHTFPSSFPSSFPSDGYTIHYSEYLIPANDEDEKEDRPTVHFVPWTREDNSNITECCICRESMDGRRKSKLSCGHGYHRNCIREWMRNKRECPLCRANISHT